MKSKNILFALLLMTMFSCSKPEIKCKCNSNFGKLEEVDMGYCEGEIPPRNDGERIYGYRKTCN
jgi:hypothetical protein